MCFSKFFKVTLQIVGLQIHSTLISQIFYWKVYWIATISRYHSVSGWLLCCSFFDHTSTSLEDMEIYKNDILTIPDESQYHEFKILQNVIEHKKECQKIE